jgi:alkaline phosphatase D
MLEQIKSHPIDALLMLGDQIYADDTGPIAPDRRLDTFFARYREAFGTEHLARLMRQVPTYMTLDDHEIEDNWPEKSSSQDFFGKFPAAILAYQTYQLSHSPLFDVIAGRIQGTPERFWYTFSDGCADFFITDTRTERVLGPMRSPDRAMLGTAQFDALTAWLIDGSGRVKFIATSVPPFGVSGDDKWDGFVKQRDRLLDYISDRQVPRVVFLSGDVHASFNVTLAAAKDPSFKVHSIVSSAFFWPFPGLPFWKFQKQGAAIKSDSTRGYQIAWRSEVHRESNFTRVTCEGNSVEVEVFERKGARLDHTTLTF